MKTKATDSVTQTPASQSVSICREFSGWSYGLTIQISIAAHRGWK